MKKLQKRRSDRAGRSVYGYDHWECNPFQPCNDGLGRQWYCIGGGPSSCHYDENGVCDALC